LKIRLLITIYLVFLPIEGISQETPKPDSKLRHIKDQSEEISKRMKVTKDVFTQSLSKPPENQNFPIETPCFKINRVELNGEYSDYFDWLKKILNNTNNKNSPVSKCIGIQGINFVISIAQNQIVAKGYVTSRVLVQHQDLSSGILLLTFVPGKINEIKFTNQSLNNSLLITSMPCDSGELLNIRDIEQGLENFKRLSSVDANFKIEPVANGMPGMSNIIIDFKQERPIRLTLGLDDSGTKSTGIYQGNVTFSYENLLDINDIFYFSYIHDLGGGYEGDRSSQAQQFHYSFPWDYWLISLNANVNNYDQTVVGDYQEYIYSGNSSNIELRISHNIHRNHNSKTEASITAFLRESKNYIDDTEIEVQRRKVGGWNLGFEYKRYYSKSVFNAAINYKIGGSFGTLSAPEEELNEGTSDFKLITGYLEFMHPFEYDDYKISYKGSIRLQHNLTTLTPQDKFAIGGRYTIRGFDGEKTLSAEQGVVFRNELSLIPSQSQQQYYWGIDYGKVSGQSTKDLIGDNLIGTVLGMRGKVSQFQYDISVGKPISKPRRFKTQNPTYALSLIWSW